MNNDYLIFLNTITPFKNKNRVWRSIENDLEIGIKNKLRKKIKLWHSLVFIFLFSVFIPMIPSANTTIIKANETGWDATLTSNNLKIIAVNPMIIEKTKVCVLWVKKHGKFFKIAKLPNSGIKNITLGKATMNKLKNSIVLISIEDKDNITQPKKIEYRRKL